MQINTNVSHRTYTSYKSNINAKYSAGYSKNNDGSLITNEPVQESSEEAGNEEITDYHEMIKEKIAEMEKSINDDIESMLLSESTMCSYPTTEL